MQDENISPNKRSDVHVSIAAVYNEKKKFEKARENAVLAVKDNPDSLYGHWNLAEAEDGLENRMKALEEYRRTRELCKKLGSDPEECLELDEPISRLNRRVQR